MFLLPREELGAFGNTEQPSWSSEGSKQDVMLFRRWLWKRMGIIIYYCCCYYCAWMSWEAKMGKWETGDGCVQELEESGWQMVRSVEKQIYNFIQLLPALQANRCILRMNVIDLLKQRSKKTNSIYLRTVVVGYTWWWQEGMLNQECNSSSLGCFVSHDYWTYVSPTLHMYFSCCTSSHDLLVLPLKSKYLFGTPPLRSYKIYSL